MNSALASTLASRVLASASSVLVSASRVLASASRVLASASRVLASASRVLASLTSLTPTQVNVAKPFNAETPVQLLTDNMYTPNELFFVRNHLPVPPDLRARRQGTALEIRGVGLEKPISLTVDELKSIFKVHTIVSTVQCAGLQPGGAVLLHEAANTDRGVFMWIRIAICDAICANCESNVKLIRNFANQK